MGRDKSVVFDGTTRLHSYLELEFGTEDDSASSTGEEYVYWLSV